MAKIIEKSQDALVNFEVVKEFSKDVEFRRRYTWTKTDWFGRYKDEVYTLSEIQKIEEFDADV